jgi:hypothetical protein
VEKYTCRNDRRPASAKRSEFLAYHALQFVGGRVAQRRDIVGEKFHFLRQPPLDDRIALIEAEGECLAVKDLLADTRVDQPAHLIGGERPAPLRSPRDFELSKIVGRHLDPIDSVCPESSG